MPIRFPPPKALFVAGAVAAMSLAGAGSAFAAVCATSPGPVAVGTAQWNGWGRDTDNSRYQAEPALRASDVPRLAVKWAFAFVGADDAGPPSVVDGRLFAGDSTGHVHALDARSGCTYWNFEAAAPVRGAVMVRELAASRTLFAQKIFKRRKVRTDAHVDVIKAPSAAFFADTAGSVYALDAERGTLVWKVAAEPGAKGVLGTPMPLTRALYVSTPDAVYALDLWTGRLLWRTLVEARSGPTLDSGRQLLYVTVPDGIVALQLADGQSAWQKHTPVPSDLRHAPILRRLPGANEILLVTDSAGAVYGFDPEHGGEILWQARLVAEHGEPRIDGGAASDHRSLYVPAAGIGLSALDILSGHLRWNSPVPRSPAHAITAIPGALFSGSLDGHLRGFSSIDGHILWDVDTARQYQAVNEAEATGGTPGRGGVVIVKGMLYVNSGNALLAYSIDGK